MESLGQMWGVNWWMDELDTAAGVDIETAARFLELSPEDSPDSVWAQLKRQQPRAMQKVEEAMISAGRKLAFHNRARYPQAPPLL